MAPHFLWSNQVVYVCNPNISSFSFLIYSSFSTMLFCLLFIFYYFPIISQFNCHGKKSTSFPSSKTHQAKQGLLLILFLLGHFTHFFHTLYWFFNSFRQLLWALHRSFISKTRFPLLLREQWTGIYVALACIHEIKSSIPWSEIISISY